MSGPPREKLHTHTGEEEETEADRELYLRDGRKLLLSEQGGEQLVEIRNDAGMVEVRIRLTEEGPVLQMESVRLSLKASESVHIESKRVEIKSSEEMHLTAQGDLVAIGKIIHLNPDTPGVATDPDAAREVEGESHDHAHAHSHSQSQSDKE